MSAIQEQSLHSVRGLGNQAERLWPLVLSLAVLVVAVPWQTRWGVIPDTSWLITLCERMLAGDRLYVDLIETNPPFSVWIYMPPVYLARLIGVAPEYVAHAYSYAICVFGLWFAGFIAQRARFVENPGLYRLVPVFLALLVLFSGNSFSERENLGVALLLPLLVLMAWRASHDRPSEPQWWLAALAGLSASVMVLVKPYFAVMIIVPAFYVAWRRRSIKPLFAIEYWAIGLACVAYLIAVLCFYPEFLNTIYPALAETYMRLGVVQALLVKYTPAYLVALYMLRLLRPGLALSPLIMVVVLASLAATVPLVYQAKGWPYHAFPAISLMAAALLLRAVQIDPAGQSPSGTGMGSARMVLLATTILANAVPFWPSQKPGADFVATIKASVDQPTVALIGSDIAAGHPLTRMVGGSWISIYCSDWLGGFATYFAQVEAQGGNQAAAEHYRQITDRYIDDKLGQLETTRPSLVIVQKADTLWLSELSGRQDFVRFMQGYRQIAEDDTLRVLVRDDARAANPL